MKSAIFDISGKRAREYFAVRKIWRYWFKAVTDPEYAICKKRLHQEAEEYKIFKARFCQPYDDYSI